MKSENQFIIVKQSDLFQRCDSTKIKLLTIKAKTIRLK